jgi:hypothetical protein
MATPSPDVPEPPIVFNFGMISLKGDFRTPNTYKPKPKKSNALLQGTCPLVGLGTVLGPARQKATAKGSNAKID